MPDEQQRVQWREQVIRYTDAFLRSLPELPAVGATVDEGIGIVNSPISEEPMPIEEGLELLERHVDPGENEGTTPGYLAFIPSGGLYAAALGDYIAAVTNRIVGIPHCSPGAARIDPMLLRWMVGFIGYPETALGDFTSGGSLPNLTAVWRVGSIGVTVAFLSPVALFVLAALVVWALSGGEWPDVQRLTEINYLPNLGLGALILWLVTFGFGEEIGWRGYALPRLQTGHSALSATLILGAMWVVWHVPAFFYLDTYVNLGLAAFPVFALGVLAGGIVLTWLYNTTSGSVLMVAIWHGVFDFLSASKASDGYIAALMSAVIMIWAVVIVIVYKPANLSRRVKHTL